MTTICILPAAGNATRMNGLPKFALPIDINNLSLIENHIKNIEKSVDKIIIATKKENLNILANLEVGMKTEIMTIESISMSDTVLQIVKNHKAKKYILIMPDTYFRGEKPYAILSNKDLKTNLIVFPIREDQKGKLGQVRIDENNRVLDIIDKSKDCDYEFAWGAVSFGNDLIKYIKKKDPHIGYAVRESLKDNLVQAKLIECEYYDCGTPNEYFDLIRKL